MNGGDLLWDTNWAWSLPLIVLNVIVHVIGLGFINAAVVDALARRRDSRHFLFMFSLVMGAITLAATMLHALEATTWAVAYQALGALPDAKTAMLYSLEAMTTFGHANLFLTTRWQLMGALEALNGMLLFGLTTAFLYGMIQLVWPLENRRWRGSRSAGAARAEAPD
jgi:hypothetical protein